jgi:acetyl esterase
MVLGYNYAPDNATRKEPSASPLLASIDQLRDLPPALVITDENDVLRDEGEAYAHKLMQANVTITATRYLGTIHDFMMLNVIADTPAVRGAIDQASEMLKKTWAAK